MLVWQYLKRARGTQGGMHLLLPGAVRVLACVPQLLQSAHLSPLVLHVVAEVAPVGAAILR